MHPKAVADAKDRLSTAQEAVATLCGTRLTHKVKRKAWLDFLYAAYGIYSKLAEGSKVNTKSVGWYATVKHIRRTDPLLAFVHHARNAEEHGLTDSSLNRGFNLSATEGIAVTPRSPKPDKDGRYYFKLKIDRKPLGTEKEPAKLKVHFPGLFLVPVTDPRSGKVFPVPTQHLGKPFSGKQPRHVAQSCLAYLDGLVSEAARLVK